MTPSFFQSLEAHKIAYLLISGQATVLYEAADFSEDVDIWIEPTDENLARFVSCLRLLKARYYKLTPAMTVDRMLAGHGFHFSINTEREFYLDVLGKPPRVTAFSEVSSRREMFELGWGKIPVIGIRDLVEVKKTQRLRDYGIVGLLAIRNLDRLGEAAIESDFVWATENIFSIADLEELAHAHPKALANSVHPDIRDFGNFRAHGGSVPTALEDQIEKRFQERMSSLQKADREYWRPIIDDLRSFKAAGLLGKIGSEI